jgi:lipid-A-disaccharide synthase
MEAALLGTPLITYYKVTGLSWLAGRFLVRVPHFSMVNLIAGRRLAPELMQNEMTGARIAQETLSLIEDPARLQAMRQGLAEIRSRLTSTEDPMERAARLIREFFDENSK